MRAEYVYNGLNWRITKRADTSSPPDGDLNQERRMYYSANWQLLEEEIDEDAAQSGFSVDRRMQYIWGTPGSGYIDDIIMRRQDDGDDGEFEDTWYHITDTLFSTVAILDDAAKLVERVSYDAYGRARHHRAGDLDGDGAADGTDQSILLGTDWNGYGVGDFNRDGVVGIPDLLFFNGVTGAALPPGRLSLTDNVVGYAGYIFNAEFNWSSGAGLYTVRHRHYAPELGRWLTRDPLGYVDGMSLYEYVRSRALYLVDPFGLQSHPNTPDGGGGGIRIPRYTNPDAVPRRDLDEIVNWILHMLKKLLTGGPENNPTSLDECIDGVMEKLNTRRDDCRKERRKCIGRQYSVQGVRYCRSVFQSCMGGANRNTQREIEKCIEDYCPVPGSIPGGGGDWVPF